MNTMLFNYMFVMQFKATIFLSCIIFSLIALFDFAEVIRMFPPDSLDTALNCTKLALLRSPHTFCEILHYVYFVAITFSLLNLTRSNQITILKASGRSPLQILYPFVWFAVCTASVWLLGLHPLGQISAKNYSSSVRRSYDETSKNIWMNFPADAMLVFVKNFANSHLQGLYAFDMQNNDRLFAQEIHIKESAWDLQDVNVISEGKIENIPRLLINFDEKLVDGQSSVHYRCIDRCASLLHHNVSDDLIRMLSKPPKKHSIYQLYKLYEIQKYCRIELKLYEMELQRLLANCMQFILFALIAAIICFPINRYKTKTSVSIKIIIISITMRFVDNILESLAYSGVVPIHLASWAVVLIALCIAIAMLVWREA